MVTGPLQMETFAAAPFLRFSLEKPQKQLGDRKNFGIWQRKPPAGNEAQSGILERKHGNFCRER
jgi:hypothetical protein